MISKKHIEKFNGIETPFYFYDLYFLRSTLDLAKKQADLMGFDVHYDLKANPNPRILKLIASYGIGADCVSGNEVAAAIEAGFKKSSIVFAGVGKTDKEI